MLKYCALPLLSLVLLSCTSSSQGNIPNDRQNPPLKPYAEGTGQNLSSTTESTTKSSSSKDEGSISGTSTNEVPPQTENTIVTEESNAGTVVSQAHTGSFPGVVGPKSGLTPDQQKKKDNYGNVIFDSKIELIQQAQSYSELQRLFPSELQFQTVVDHPRFLEYQKALLLLGIYTNELMKSSPEFIALRLKRDEISSAKKIWPTELQEIEKKIESLAKETPSNSTSSSEIMTLSLKQIELLESFMKSKEYSDFIKETQSEIDQINEKMNALKPVELVHAEHDVSVLYKKIYTSGQ